MTVVLSICGTLISMFWRAFVIVRLWEWFVVTTFHAIPINKAQAYGIVLVLSVVHQNPIPKDKKGLLESHIEDLIVPALALIAGWVIRGWL